MLQSDADQSIPLIRSAPRRWEPSAGSLPWNALEAFNGIDELIDRGHDFQAYPMRRSTYTACARCAAWAWILCCIMCVAVHVMLRAVCCMLRCDGVSLHCADHAVRSVPQLRCIVGASRSA